MKLEEHKEKLCFFYFFAEKILSVFVVSWQKQTTVVEVEIFLWPGDLDCI